MTKEHLLQLNNKLLLIVKALEDIKARDIAVFDTISKTPAFERAVLCSGTSSRHARALALNVVREARQAGLRISGIEGEDAGDWVLVDLGDVVVHCMQKEARDYYDLEELWGPEKLDLHSVAAMKPGQRVPADISILG